MSLTLRKIKSIERRAKWGRTLDEHGLYLQIAMGGAASWVFRYTWNGKERWMELRSAASPISLRRGARCGAKGTQASARRQIPLQVREAAKAADALKEAQTITFRAAATQYFEGKEKGWRNATHRSQFKNTLEADVYPTLGDLPVAAIDTGLVLRTLKAIWEEKPETANRVRGRIEAVLDWAKSLGYRTGDNAAKWGGHLEYLLAAPGKIRKVVHHPALPYAEIAAFMADLRGRYMASRRAPWRLTVP